MTTPATAPHSTAPNQNKRTSKASAQSLNHLLNFTLPPRQSHNFSGIPRRARKTGNQHGIWNKERFVNAQYRFVMNPTGDYTVHFADPDIYFQWSDILQVIVPRGSNLSAASREQSVTEDVLSCPICLSPPTAPRMTKCGHVFCYPCILHLLSTSEQLKWVRCPICFDSVNERQLKAVKWLDEVLSDAEEGPVEGSSSSTSLDHDPSAAGSLLRMRLIQRPQITTLALPRSSTWPSDLIPPHQAPFHFLPDVLAFAKFMLATPSELVQDLTKDLEDLATERRLLTGMGDELGAVFIDAADAKVRHQIEKATVLDTPHLREAIETTHHLVQQLRERTAHDRQRREEAQSAAITQEEVPQVFLATQGPGFAASTPPTRESAPTPTPGRNQRQRRNLNPPPPSTSTYYYYQAASGQPIFLHPLDIKILFSHFHSYPAFPDEITVRVESRTESTVNDDLRKRCKYLAHLPEGADVVFVEADLTDVVGAEGLRPFEGALKSRRNRRKEKGRKDDKARARAEVREQEKLAQTWHEFGYAPRAPVGPVTVPLDIARDTSPVGAPPSDPEQDVSPPQPTGAWGARSFASAAHAAQSRPLSQRPRVAAVQSRERAEDEWELDMAFHELERGAKGGGKKKNNRLVVLGGGGGRRAR